MNFLKKFAFKTAESELKDYIQKLSLADKKDLGLILGHSYVILSQLIKKYPEIKEIIRYAGEDDKYSKELSSLVLQTNRIIKDFYNMNEVEDATGMKL